MDELDVQVKTMQFLQCFDSEIQSLIVRLRRRYKDRPKEPAKIVIAVVATICARLIVGTAPKEFWEPMIIGIVNGLDAEYKKDIDSKGGK